MAQDAQAKSAAQILREKNRSETVALVKEHVEAACSLLRPLGADYERIAWMIEDSLMYLDEALYQENEKRGNPVESNSETEKDERVEMS